MEGLRCGEAPVQALEEPRRSDARSRPERRLHDAVGEVHEAEADVGFRRELQVLEPRKRFRFLQILGATRHWFRLHMIFGLLGPLLILYHSNFHLGSFNSRVAFYAMLLVAEMSVQDSVNFEMLEGMAAPQSRLLRC